MKKLAGFGYHLFCILFLLFLAMVLGISFQAVKTASETWVLLLSGTVTLGSALILLLLPDKKNRSWNPALPVILGLLLKLLCFQFLGSKMGMKYDYLTALESAQGIFAEKELIYAHWAVYPRILSVFFGIFGGGYPQAVIFNLLVTALSTLLVYQVCQGALHQPKLSFLAAMLFALWPSFNLYHLITSNEFLAILFGLLSVYLVQLATARTGGLRILFSILAGLSLGLTDFFKQFSIIFFIAAGITGLLWHYLHPLRAKSPAEGSLQKNRQKKNAPGSSSWVSLLLCCVLLFSAGGLCKATVFSALDRYLGAPVCRSANAHFLYMGLNSTGNGEWNDEVGFDFRHLAEDYNRDYDRAAKELYQILREDLRAHPDKLPQTLRHKLTVDWSADRGVLDWVRALYTGEGGLPYADRLQALSNGFYLALFLLMAVGGIGAFRRKNPWILLLSLIVFGFALVLVLTEAQGRYQLVLFPWFAILAANGADSARGAVLRLTRK